MGLLFPEQPRLPNPGLIVMFFKKIFHKQSDKWHKQELEAKWLFIFKIVSETKEYSCLLKVVLFCIAGL